MANEPFDASEAARELARIRRIMESATQLTVLPGWAAILGGLLALMGCGVTYWLLESMDFSRMSDLDPGKRWAITGLWIGIGTGGIGLDVLLTARLARRRGKNPWSRLAQLAAYAMGPPLAAALIISLSLALGGQWGPVPAVWMILYGVAIWMTGILSVRAPGMLGLVFVLAGTLTLFFAESMSLVLIGATFGLAHIVFGIYLLARFGN